MKKFNFIFTLLLVLTLKSFAVNPLPDGTIGTTGNWTYQPEYSDEFDGNLSKWNINPNSWGTWSWDANLTKIVNGELQITTQYNKHTRSGDTYYFKSGIARQIKTITQGYFEARLKGPAYFPGLCPAFWMYSQQPNFSTVIKYNEVDFCEPQQRAGDIKKIDTNTHYVLAGTNNWIDTKNFVTVDFNSNEGYHTYACWLDGDNITFYIDGKELYQNTNGAFFILPMTITLSQGLRPPLMEYLADGTRVPVVYDAKPTDWPATDAGTTMNVDYVRVWTKTTSSVTGVKNEKITDNSNLLTISSKSINYIVNEAGPVNISIFDLEGKKVTELLNSVKAAGSYSIDFNSKTLKSESLYICKVQTATTNEARKFIYNK